MLGESEEKEPDLNNCLQHILDVEGYTQADLASLSGINATTINLICRGRQKFPRPATKSRLTKGINQLVGSEKYKVIDIFYNGLARK